MTPTDFPCPFCMAPKGSPCEPKREVGRVHVAREKAAGRWALHALEAPCPACLAPLRAHEVSRFRGIVTLRCPNVGA